MKKLLVSTAICLGIVSSPAFAWDVEIYNGTYAQSNIEILDLYMSQDGINWGAPIHVNLLGYQPGKKPLTETVRAPKDTCGPWYLKMTLSNPTQPLLVWNKPNDAYNLCMTPEIFVAPHGDRALPVFFNFLK